MLKKVRAIIIAMLAAAVIAGTPAAAAPVDSAQAYSDALARLTPIQRLAALRRAILDSGEKCRRVTEAKLQGRWRNLIMWSARCDVGGDYGAYIGPDGSVQVRQCGQTKLLGLPQCTLPPRPAAK
jgi:hypothetical protein